MPGKKTKKKAGNKFSIFIFRKSYLIVPLTAILIAFIFITKNNNPPCANSISCISDLSGKVDTNAKTGIFNNQLVKVPDYDFNSLPSKVLGVQSNTAKHINIDLANQKLFALENGNVIMEFLVSTGKWGRTPTGEFMTWIKVKSTRMKGGSKEKGTYYDLPNVPYTMFFYNTAIPKYRGYGIHGAYWHNNFGHPMSHGCINMKPDDAKVLYEWANPQTDKFSILITPENPGTGITIYGKAPPY